MDVLGCIEPSRVESGRRSAPAACLPTNHPGSQQQRQDPARPDTGANLATGNWICDTFFSTALITRPQKWYRRSIKVNRPPPPLLAFRFAGERQHALGLLICPGPHDTDDKIRSAGWLSALFASFSNG
jgi:hypothetical protein